MTSGVRLTLASGAYRFERFTLDMRDRQLRRDDVPVALNARYLDALALLVREQGGLVSKDRFLAEVWRGVPVTDEALTQCIRTLRRQLGDDAAAPRFILTVPKHGYRFIAAVELHDPPGGLAAGPAAAGWRTILTLGGAGTIGGGAAGAIGGLFYGVMGAAQPLTLGVGAVSVLLVLLALTVLIGLVGGAGVGVGVGVAELLPGRPWWRAILGGALGGLGVGAAVKVLGLDAFNLLFGHAPGQITGAAEGIVLGGAAGLGLVLAERATRPRDAILAGAATGGAAGLLIALLGGRLMAGSLDALAHGFPGSRLRLDQIGRLFGETDLGPLSLAVTGAVEGLLFGACVVGAMTLVRRRPPGGR